MELSSAAVGRLGGVGDGKVRAGSFLCLRGSSPVFNVFAGLRCGLSSTTNTLPGSDKCSSSYMTTSMFHSTIANIVSVLILL